MQGTAWNELLRRIPPEQHDSLILVTTTGTELMMQRLIRLEQDFVVAIGRPSGSTDQGKALIIPYDQLTYMALTKQMSDAEVQAILGSPAVPISNVAPAPPPPVSTSGPDPVGPGNLLNPVSSLDSQTDTPGPDMAGNSPFSKPPSKSGPPSKSMLLARLRQRLAEDKSKQKG